MKLLRSLVPMLALGLGLAVLPSGSSAQTNAGRPVKFVVGFAAGGPADGIARAIGKALEEELKQPVVIENRPGAAGSIGLQAVTASPPDGLTIGLLSNTTTNTFNFAGKKLDIENTFTPVGRFTSTNILLVAGPLMPDVKTLPEFVDHLRRNPGTTVTSAGHGGLGHLGFELLALDQKLKITHVPYKGSAPAMLDVIAGRVAAMVVDATSAMPHLQSGKLRAIAAVSAQRVPSLPDLPTALEQGVPSLQIDSIIALVMPPRTPQPLVNQMAEALRRAVDSPGYVEAARAAGNARYFRDGAELRAWLEKDFDRWGRVIREANIKLE